MSSALDENFKAVADGSQASEAVYRKGRYLTKATITSTMNRAFRLTRTPWPEASELQ